MKNCQQQVIKELSRQITDCKSRLMDESCVDSISDSEVDSGLEQIVFQDNEPKH
jgi:hypothetical protein